MISDGYNAYVPIIEKLHYDSIKMSIFIKIINQRTPMWKTTYKMERQLQRKEDKLEKTQKIQQLQKPVQRAKTWKNTAQGQKKMKK